MLSPRSTAYERLETGMGPSSSARKRFGWKKLAVAAGVLIGIVWVFGPRSRRDYVLGGPTFARPDLSKVDYEPPPPPPAPKPPRPDVGAPDDELHILPVNTPSSPDSDPDALKTVFCSKPFDPNSHLVQYALMIDAGSTGSRIHIYKFNNCGPSPQYEYEVFKQTKPGLSAYSSSPDEAAASLDVLLEEALKVVPPSLAKCTPVAVKATAGLRLLGLQQSVEILDTVQRRLHDRYPFPLAEKDGVVIMDGKDEGVYAWITANYLLDTIRADSPDGTPPYAVLDLGGGSTQIVFEPSFDASAMDSSLAEGDHKYELLFGGRMHVLYQHSYLGYGLMSARESVHKLVDYMRSFGKGADDDTVVNPCLAQGTTRVVKIVDERYDVDERNVTMIGADIGSYEACNRVVQLVMAKDAICEVKPCSFRGVYQPSILESFPSGKILLLSYFYDRLTPLLPPTQSSLSISTIAELAHTVCLGRSAWLDRWGSDTELMEELEGRPEYCLDLTFMYALLRLGYEFPDDREVGLGKQIDGTELGWALGAGIALVGGELECRI